MCKCHRKTPMLESVFNKIVGVQVYNFIKRRLQHSCFSCEHSEMFKNTFLKEYLATAASCLSEAKYTYPINYHMCWIEHYISTMVYQNVLVLCFAWSFLLFFLKDLF